MSDIPVFSTLDFYAYPQLQYKRYQQLWSQFETEFEASPDFIARSPGRVNLIGEHVDYSYFPLLPLAIEVDTILGVKVTKQPFIQLRNTSPHFTAKKIELPADGSFVSVNSENPDWSDYFKCGVIVAHKFLNESNHHSKTLLNGLDILLDGTVPTGGGLSSSAALICATALAVLAGNGLDDKLLTKDNLASICTSSERYLGINTGGMDQTASICGVKNNALFVNFKPKITATTVEFPKTEEPFEFVIANSLVVSNKLETAPRNYNLRVVEVNTAAEVLAYKFGVKIPQDSGFSSGTLKGFMDVYFKDDKVTIDKLTKLLEMVETVFAQKKEFTISEAATAMGVSVEEYTNRFLTHDKVIFDKLKLYKRSKHVFTETARVISLIELMKKSSNDNFMQEFGQLMNDSQASCRDDYECSCQQLDDICQIALANGSSGSRLTGAGWGGCTVHLVPASKLENVKKALVNEYYLKRYPDITNEELKEAIVVSRPAWGSSLYIGGVKGLGK